MKQNPSKWKGLWWVRIWSPKKMYPSGWKRLCLAQKNSKKNIFLTLLHVSISQYFFPTLNSNCSNSLYLRNLQEQVKKAFCYQKLFKPFTVRLNCSSDLKNFESSRPSASNYKSFSQSIEQFFLCFGKNTICVIFSKFSHYICTKKSLKTLK